LALAVEFFLKEYLLLYLLEPGLATICDWLICGSAYRKGYLWVVGAHWWRAALE
jgi:hypothetical protein